MYYENNYLAHHGIKGQRWGIRRYQDNSGRLTDVGFEHVYGHGRIDVKKVDTDMQKYGVRSEELRKEHTIPKGTTIYRTTSVRDENDEGTTYVSYLDIDRQHYKGGWIRQQGKTGEAYEHTYVLNEDIKVPSRETTQQVVNEVMHDNPELLRQTAKAWIDVAMPEGSYDRVERITSAVEDLFLRDVKSGKRKTEDYMNMSDEDYKKYSKRAIDVLIDDQMKYYKDMSLNEAAFYTMQTLGLNSVVRNKVISRLKAKGFNAMTDEASVGGQNGWMKEGGDPIILFDRKGMLTETSNKQISKYEEDRANAEYRKISQKARSSSGAWSAINNKNELRHSMWRVRRKGSMFK